VQLGDTVQWVQLDPPTMTHTITSDNIPNGAIPFDQIWQLPADTFFQYIPQVVGLYQYVCTPHIPFGMIGEFTVVNGPQTYVPDNNFEQALINLGYDNILDDSVLTANINTITTLDVTYQNISDLSGIEAFTALIDLQCYSNSLTSLDVSQNTALTYLNCNNNQLTSLDVSNNLALTNLYCNNNQLTSLNLSNNIALTTLWCTNNQFTSLDVSTATALTYLHCFWNPNLYCIDVDDVAWADTNWTVTNGNIDATMSFSSNCVSALGCTDSLACNYDALATIDDSSCIYGILSSSYDTLSVTTSIVWNSNTLNVSGDYSDTLINSAGCDSIANLNLTITNTTGLLDIIDDKRNLVKITDMLGQETPFRKNTPLFYIYDDGTLEKRIVIE
jgi:hypothetical protein